MKPIPFLPRPQPSTEPATHRPTNPAHYPLHYGTHADRALRARPRSKGSYPGACSSTSREDICKNLDIHNFEMIKRTNLCVNVHLFETVELLCNEAPESFQITQRTNTYVNVRMFWKSPKEKKGYDHLSQWSPSHFCPNPSPAPNPLPTALRTQPTTHYTTEPMLTERSEPDQDPRGAICASAHLLVARTFTTDRTFINSRWMRGQIRVWMSIRLKQ